MSSPEYGLILLSISVKSFGRLAVFKRVLEVLIGSPSNGPAGYLTLRESKVRQHLFVRVDGMSTKQRIAKTGSIPVRMLERKEAEYNTTTPSITRYPTDMHREAWNSERTPLLSLKMLVVSTTGIGVLSLREVLEHLC